MSQQSKKVIISGTVRDLPEHRKELMDACLRQGMLPLMMEHLPASDSEAISASLALVDEADIYVGILAHRYGDVPKENNPQQLSITEMEYIRAVERDIPRLIFLIDKAHPITFDDVEMGEGALKLKAFKERLQTTNIINHFKSPADLRAHVINSLSRLREPDLNTFHYISDIPAPPEAFIAHPYTLLQTHRLVGRQQELNLLTDWVTKKQEEIYWTRILSVVAIGGMGKSALTWKWFNDIAPQEMKPLAGRMWWSFYESDASFENFVTRALGYVTRQKPNEVQKIPPPERESQLLAALDRETFLIVLDGLERILIAYARMDAAHLSDDDYDRQTANFVANAYDLPASAAQSFTGEHRLRKTADPRTGSFLRKLANVRAARILISTRLYPADLQTITGDSLNNSAAIFLKGLIDDDALNLWRAFGVSGSRDSLIPMFNRFEKHPLLIQALASEVSRYRRSPGNFEDWRRDHPDFDPFSLPLVNVKSHVLDFALRGLNEKARQALYTIAAFRMPALYDTLSALLIGEERACVNEHELDVVLSELEDRGLIGWDKRANRYDLHPIVRGVVWGILGDDMRRNLYTTLHTHFDSLPKIDDWKKVNSLEDLTPAIELYNTLIGLGRYDDAYIVLRDRLDKAMFYRLSANHQNAELWRMLFPDGLDQIPRVSKASMQASALDALGQAYHMSGQLKRAASLLRRANEMDKIGASNRADTSTSLSNISFVLCFSGSLYESEDAARHALTTARKSEFLARESSSLSMLGLMLATCGREYDSATALNRSLRIALKASAYKPFDLQAMRAVWYEHFTDAIEWANKAIEYCKQQRFERGMISAARLKGVAALGLNDFTGAKEMLHQALTRARSVNLIEEELQALFALAELRRRQGDLKAAREFLDDMWEPAERGPFPLFHADAFNVLAQIERDAGNINAAAEAATKAYRLAWCDGPPFAYHWGLVAARNHLQELGAAEPDMPPFDESKFEPMPEVEINPQDEFHVEETAEN